MKYVYAIIHPETKERQYVGCTNNLERRLGQHLSNSHNLRLRAWINKLVECGMAPQLELLETVPATKSAVDAEGKWITQCDSHNALFNCQEVGGTRGRIPRSKYFLADNN